ncbi:Mu transposase C-terminal domain-containing protein [Streptomyces gardneri]|uniref:Mu transposase C-terminal domain-containing protein n=1 Tax=Streptomyces gardneri TaxID=66892 RepID=UPI0036A0F915
MSITSPIPALTGPGGTGALVDRDILLVRGATEEMQVLLRGVARLRAEGRGLAVEMTAEAGAVPAVYRFEGADEAAVAAFADAVNALLPEEPARVDGTQYMSGVRRGGDLQQRKLSRAIKHGSLYGALLIVAMSVTAGFTGPAVNVVGIVGCGSIGLLLLAVCAMIAYAPYREWHLRRHGVRVAAVRVPGEMNSYAYRDPAGLERLVTKPGGAWTVDVAYDPRDPGRVVVLRPRGRRILDLVVLGIVAFFGLGFFALTVTATVLIALGLDGA